MRQIQLTNKMPPNLSISRTCPGKPGHAAYLKRWFSLKDME
jgi:hypothetical protein